MSLKEVKVREMDSVIWMRAKIAMIKRKEHNPHMTMAKWLQTAILAQLRKENG
ncbi:hypothetical protein LCGC14_1558570 [marine sediment metagenome]|uniref:Uncharacterized protein n=1 Tax=marine sediment metagenome TaxID=412755 RepID=A0A0F9IN95_9ZZZZ